MIQVGEKKATAENEERIYPNSSVINFYIVHTHGETTRKMQVGKNYLGERLRAISQVMIIY